GLRPGPSAVAPLMRAPRLLAELDELLANLVRDAREQVARRSCARVVVDEVAEVVEDVGTDTVKRMRRVPGDERYAWTDVGRDSTHSRDGLRREVRSPVRAEEHGV